MLVTAAGSPPAFGDADTKLNDACHSMTDRRLPPLLLYSQASTIEPARMPIKNPGTIRKPSAT